MQNVSKSSGSHLLQDFQSVSDQFGVLRIKWLKENKNNRLIRYAYF